MAGVRAFSAVPQDENSAATAFRAASAIKGSLENSIHTGFPAASQKVQTEAKPSRRRALGDITNSVRRPAPPSASDLCSSKQQAVPKAEAPSTSSSVSAHATQLYHEDPEKYAGKTWDQLEVEREQREDAAIAARVRTMLSGLTMWPTLGLQMQEGTSDDDEDAPLHLAATTSATAPGAANSGVGTAATSSSQQGMELTDDAWLAPPELSAAAELLPDVELDLTAWAPHPSTPTNTTSPSSSSTAAVDHLVASSSSSSPGGSSSNNGGILLAAQAPAPAAAPVQAPQQDCLDSSWWGYSPVGSTQQLVAEHSGIPAAAQASTTPPSSSRSSPERGVELSCSGSGSSGCTSTPGPHMHAGPGRSPPPPAGSPLVEPW